MRNTRSLAITLTGIMLLTAFGCAHMGGGSSDSDLINETLTTWTEASKAKDIDKAMSVISENFKHDGDDYTAEGKEAMRAVMEESLAMGSFDDLEISYDPEAITIDAGTAQVPEIEWDCAPGTAFIDLTLKKEQGSWRIVDADIEGM